MASIFKEASCNNHPEWAYGRPLYAAIIIQSLFIMFELTVTAHIILIRWCFYLIPYYLLKSLCSCREKTQKSHAQRLKDHPRWLFPSFPKYSSQEFTLNSNTTKLVHNIILLALTRMLVGEIELMLFYWSLSQIIFILGEQRSRSDPQVQSGPVENGFNILLDDINI